MLAITLLIIASRRFLLGRPALEVDLPEAPVLLSISLSYYYRLAAAAAVTRTHFSSRDQFVNLPVTVDTIRGLDENAPLDHRQTFVAPAVQCAFR